MFCGLDLCTLSRQQQSKCSDQVSLLLQWFFWYNIWQILLTPSLSGSWSVRHSFRLKTFHLLLVILSPYRCAQNFDIVKFKFFSYPPCLIIILINSFFDWISRKLVKTNGSPLLGLSSQDFFLTTLLTLCSVLFNDLEISLTKWPNDRKNLPEL